MVPTGRKEAADSPVKGQPMCLLYHERISLSNLVTCRQRRQAEGVIGGPYAHAYMPARARAHIREESFKRGVEGDIGGGEEGSVRGDEEGEKGEARGDKERNPFQPNLRWDSRSVDGYGVWEVQ